MVRGIATDNKKYKHINRNNEKWLCKDLYVFKRYTEKYINNLKYDDENELDKSQKNGKKKIMTVDRVIAIIFLGIFGSITLLTGIYLVLKQVNFLSVSLLIFGIVFVVAFCLYEKYR